MRRLRGPKAKRLRALKEARYMTQQGFCCLCGRKMDPVEPIDPRAPRRPRAPTIEHVVSRLQDPSAPRGLGECAWWLACHECNFARAKREWSHLTRRQVLERTAGGTRS